MRSVVFYRDKKREWRWRYLNRGGKILADSGEGYKRLGPCRKSCDIVTGNQVMCSLVKVVVNK